LVYVNKKKKLKNTGTTILKGPYVPTLIQT